MLNFGSKFITLVITESKFKAILQFLYKLPKCHMRQAVLNKSYLNWFSVLAGFCASDLLLSSTSSRDPCGRLLGVSLSDPLQITHVKHLVSFNFVFSPKSNSESDFYWEKDFDSSSCALWVLHCKEIYKWWRFKPNSNIVLITSEFFMVYLFAVTFCSFSFFRSVSLFREIMCHSSRLGNAS